MDKIREPVQKRSIATKDKIAQSGFKLFCKKGYHKTNTTEIAKHAQVSTGALYSYFRDKRDIYIAAFDQYIYSFTETLLMKLNELPTPFELTAFINNWTSSYIEIYAKAGYALMQLRLMMLEDEVINKHFCNLEIEYVSQITAILNRNGISSDDLKEKVYISCILIDNLNREKNEFPHNSLDFISFKKQIEATIYTILSNLQ